MTREYPTYLECEVTAQQRQIAHEYRIIRQRLQAPPAAKQDRPIAFKRPHGITGWQAQINARAAAAEARERRYRETAELQAEALKRKEAERAKVQDKIATERDWLIVTDDTRKNSYPQNILHQIKRIVAAEFDVSLVDIDSSRRTTDVSLARHVAWYLCKILTLKSLPEIARAYNGRHHTSVLFALRKIPVLMRANAELCQRVVWLEAEINAELARNLGLYKG